MRKLPLAIDDSESNVFVRWACTEMQKHGLIVARLLDDLVRRRLGLVDEVGVEYVKLRMVISRGRRIHRTVPHTLYPWTTLGGGLSVLNVTSVSCVQTCGRCTYS